MHLYKSNSSERVQGLIFMNMHARNNISCATKYNVHAFKTYLLIMPRKRTRLFNKAKPDPPAPCILKGKAKMIFPIIPLETSNAFEQTARTY